MRTASACLSFSEANSRAESFFMLFSSRVSFRCFDFSFAAGTATPFISSSFFACRARFTRRLWKLWCLRGAALGHIYAQVTGVSANNIQSAKLLDAPLSIRCLRSCAVITERLRAYSYDASHSLPNMWHVHIPAQSLCSKTD